MSFASCCLLSFERKPFLRTAITTLLAEAEAPLELIVHDDGSTDPELLDMLSGLQRSGVISTLILNPPGHNEGVGQAIRRCFAIARGDPIIKLDQDLVFKKGWLREVNRIFYENGCSDVEPPLGALGAFHYPADPVDHVKMHRRDWPAWQEVEDFVGSFIAVPRDVYEVLGPIETHSEAFAEDVAFKKKLQAADMALGLPRDDIAVNQGFGIGPSTVVLGHEHVQSIHKEPLIHEP